MLKDSILRYHPKNEQEKVDQKLILKCIDETKDILDRSSLAYHMTASSFIVNDAMDQILFGYHHIYDSWAWLGGHADGNPNLLEVAIKEAKEESGLVDIKAYSDDIFTLDVILVHNHIKNGQYVPDHLHLNVSYLLIANPDDMLQRNPEEHQDLKWFSLNDVLSHVSEPRMMPVYQKAFKIIEGLKR